MKDIRKTIPTYELGRFSARKSAGVGGASFLGVKNCPFTQKNV